jgi:hypothetical protein
MVLSPEVFDTAARWVYSISIEELRYPQVRPHCVFVLQEVPYECVETGTRR